MFKKIIIILIIALLIFSLVIVHEVVNKMSFPIIFTRTIQPNENLNIRTYESFRGKIDSNTKEYFQKFCEGNTNDLNDKRVREIYGNDNYHEYYNTFRNYHYISTSFTTKDNVLDCYSFKSIKPDKITKPITQLFFDFDLYKSNIDLTEFCKSSLYKINKNIKSISFSTLEKDNKLIVCEGSN